ncbi:MAG: Autophagy-related protein 22-like protein [Geminicoccaceae bacterium]|nr:Autophagy-related protein 22-like protein [Geminicoccaceae bacterium]
MSLLHSVWARLGLARPELRAWAMYDWAASAVQTTIMVAVFPIYFVRVAGANLPPSSASQRLATINTLALVVIAVLSPILGAVSDYGGIKKRLLAAFMILGAGSTAGMFWVQRGDIDLASILFTVSLIGAAGSFVFYEALLPHIARPHEIDRVSTAGYALGYVGGGLLLALNLAWIQKPAWFGLPSGPGTSESTGTLPVRLAFVSVAVWWVLFSIPLFRRVSEPPARLEPDEHPHEGPLKVAFLRLGETFRELRGYRQAFLMLVAFLIYNDGIQTIIKMATAYGTEIGIGQNALIGAILLVQFVGIPCSFLFGALAVRIGTKPAIFIGLIAYTAISILGYFMTNASHFYMLAGLVGLVQGGTQALSRSLFASMIPPHKSGEFFGFFSVFEKFAGIFGPLIYAGTIAVTGSSRNSILSVIGFFAVGGAILAFVDVGAGRRAAMEAEARVVPLARPSAAS